MSEIKPELVERMVDLVRGMAGDATVFPSLSSMDHYTEARNIVERLPAPADPDEQATAWLLHTMDVDGFIFANRRQAEEIASRAIKCGRKLATPASETDQLGGVGV